MTLVNATTSANQQNRLVEALPFPRIENSTNLSTVLLEDSKCNQKKKNSNSIKVVLKKYLSEEANKRERERDCNHWQTICRCWEWKKQREKGERESKKEKRNRERPT